MAKIQFGEKIPSLKGSGVIWRQKLAKSAHRFRGETSGATAVMVALLMPVVVLGMGLGAETSFQFMTQRKLQHAADLAAHAGAARLRAGDTLTAITAAATYVAVEGGFRPATSTFSLNTPPLSGIAAGDPQSVEVILNHSQPRYLSKLISKDPVLIGARAVARVASTRSTACVLALSPTASGAITISGSTSVGLSGCDIAANSNAADALLMSGGSAALSAHCAHTVGRAVVTGQLQLTGCPQVREFAPVVRDPYKSVAEPAVVGACRNKNHGNPNSTTTLTPNETHPSGMKSMRFCNGLDLKGNVNFGPGLYIIEGGNFTVHNAGADSSAAVGMIGNGVIFFLTGSARLVINGNANMSLSAPTAGPFAGLLFFASRSQGSITHKLAGTSGSTVHGAVYAPASTLEMTGNSKSSGGCTQIIGNRVVFTGNSSLRADCTNAGTSDILASESISIVE